MRRRAALTVVAIVLLVAGVLAVRRHEAINWVLPRLLSLASGYDISISDQKLGTDHGALIGVHVAKHGDRVLDADRIDVWYNPVDLLPGSLHRYGINAIAIDHPRLAIVRHADGGYNIAIPKAEIPAGPAAPEYPNHVPLNLTIRIAYGSGVLSFPEALDLDSRLIEFANVNMEAGINSARVTQYAVNGVMIETQPQPFSLAGKVDEERGFAMHHARAKVVPLRAIANFFINSKAAHILAGDARNFDAKAYALDVAPHEPIDYHISGSLAVSNAAMNIIGFAKPLEHIAGRLEIVDDTFFSNGLSARLAGAPVAVSGGIFQFAQPQFRLGLVTKGDLSNLREVFAFSHGQPVSGNAIVHAVIEGPVSSPIVLARADAKAANYRGIPLRFAHVDLSYANGNVTIAPLIANVGEAQLAVRGTLDIGNAVRSRLVLHVNGNADSLPYAGELLGKEPLVADAMLDGTGMVFTGYGALASTRGIDRAAAVIHVAPTGGLDVEPMWANIGSGTFAAAYHLDRSTDASAFWINAYQLHLNTSKGSFPSGILPSIPAIDGVVDSLALEGGGQSGTNALVAGDLHAHDARVAGVALDDIRATFAGRLADAAVDPVVARGPWGSIVGAGALSTGALAVRGAYTGTLQGLRGYLSDPTAVGTARGTAALAIDRRGITIQAQDLALTDARVHGLPVSSVQGTFGVSDGALRVYSGNATVAGGNVVAAGTTRRGVALVGHNVNGADLRNIGLPIDAGTLAINGAVVSAASLAQYTGGFSLARGKSGPYNVAGSGLVAMHGTTAHLDHVVGSLDGNVALLKGDVNAITSGTPTYDVRANVPAADVTRTLHMLALPTFYSDGTYNANLAITGSGVNPDARGPINVPAGSINGLPYVDASALVHANRSGVAAGSGNVLVGTTAVRFFAAANPGISGLRVRAPRARLEDFDNFFDTGDTLGGAGAVRFNVFSQRHRISSNGGIDVKGLRYRNFPIGDTRASWSSLHNTLSGSLAADGTYGALRANGSIGLTPSSQWTDVVKSADYHVSLDLDQLDTSTWLGVAGFNYPFTGRMDADARIDGRYPNTLQVNGTASLADGSIWRLPIESADLAFSTKNRRIRIDSGSLVAPGLTATARGTLGFAPRDPLALDIYLNSNDVPKLTAQLYHVTLPVRGEVESTVSIGGSIEKPTFSAAFDATNAVAYGVKIPSIFGSLRWNKNANALELRNAGVQFERGSVSLAGTLPLVLEPFGVGPSKAPVSMNLALEGLDPGVFDTLVGNNTQMSGTINGEFQVAGSIGSPRIYGRFALSQGSYLSDLERAPITKAQATLTFDRTQAAIQNFGASFGTGTLSGSGHVAFTQAGGATFEVDADARNAQLNLPALGAGAISGKAVLARAAGQQATLSGRVSLHDATIPFAAFLAATQSSGASGGLSFPVKLGFDMDLSAGKNVRVRGGGLGAGLDIGATGAVHLAGTLAAPTLDGGFVSTGGTLTYFDRAFRVQEANVTFTPSDGIIPELHAKGITHVSNPDPNPALNPYGSSDVTIAVDGPINGLKIAFSSNPPGYTDEQVLAMIAPFSGLISGSSNAAYGNGALKQEAFNILNAQFTAGLLAPFESALSQGLGLQNVDLNVDYYGRVGITATRLLGKTVNFVYSQTFGIPARQSVGLQLLGREATSAQLTFYWMNGPQTLFPTLYANSNLGRLSIGQPYSGNGFSFTLQRLYW